MTPSIASRSRIEHLSRRSRRLFAVLTLLGLPSMYAWSAFWTGTSIPVVVWGWASFVLMGVTLVGAYVLYRYVRGRADLADVGLDERERALRDRAWILSYQVLAVVVVVLGAAIVVPVLGFGHAVTVDATLASAVAICLGVLLPLLPVAALAWLEPDPFEEA